MLRRMWSALAPIIRTMLSLTVALTMLLGHLSAPASAGPRPAGVEAGRVVPDQAAEPADADLLGSEADGDEDRAHDSILPVVQALVHPRAARTAALRPDARVASGSSFEFHRPPRLASASLRSKVAARA